MIESGCPNCNGSLFSESYKAEGHYFIEITCINCARQWTPRTIHEIVEAHLATGDIGKAQRVSDGLDAAIKKESRNIPVRLRTNN